MPIEPLLMSKALLAIMAPTQSVVVPSTKAPSLLSTSGTFTIPSKAVLCDCLDRNPSDNSYSYDCFEIISGSVTNKGDGGYINVSYHLYF